MLADVTTDLSGYLPHVTQVVVNVNHNILGQLAVVCRALFAYMHTCSSPYHLPLSLSLSLLSYRSLVCPPPQSWQTGWGFVTTFNCCQPKYPLHLPTLVSSDSICGGGWGSLCRMRTSSQWYEITEVRLFTLEQSRVFTTFSFHFPSSTSTYCLTVWGSQSV